MARGMNTKANGIDFRANRFDEFLKLIPQNLTDAEKAQVMANLGITPTPGSLDGAVRYDAAQTLTDEQKQQAQENAGVDEALAEKANIDGYYSQLTAGAAENLVGGSETSREFTEDTAGGTADIADGIVQVERIKGNSVVWNQKFSYLGYWSDNVGGTGITIRKTGHKCIITNIPTTNIVDLVNSNNYNFIVGRKYYVSIAFKTEVQGMLNLRQGGAGLLFFSNVIFASGHNRFSVIKTADRTNSSIVFRVTLSDASNEVVLDSLIITDLTQMFGAGNEPSTVGEFEKLFPLDYYDYNAGEILSLNPAGIKTVGFNAYNPSTGKASVIGGKQYQITGAYTSIIEGDTAITPDSDGIFIPTMNGDLTIAGGNSTTGVHLVWSGVRNGEYEEYWEELRNIPVAQINTDGTITESAVGKTRLFPNGLCSVGESFDEVRKTKAIKRIGARAYEEGDKEDTSVLTDGTTTLYVLDTPIEVTFAEPLNLTYSVSDFGTETLLPVNGSEPVTAPIKMDVVYGLNVVDFVRNANKNFVTIEDSTGDNGSTFTNLRIALSTAFGIDIVPTFDAANKRYTFVVTDNRKVDTPPTSSVSTGIKGSWAVDGDYFYFCVHTNYWIRVAKTDW